MAITNSGNASAVREDGTYSSDKDTTYDYVLRYIALSKPTKASLATTATLMLSILMPVCGIS